MSRGSEIFISILLLIVFLLPMALIAVYLICVFGKNFLFVDERFGLNNTRITLFKFRTMWIEKNLKKSTATEINDKRIIPFGKFLRKHRLDELPQILNVLSSTIALVGPRPEQIEFSRYYSKKIPHYDMRYKIKPGLTGLAQISSGYASDEEQTRTKLKYDLWYIANRTWRLDMSILLQTILVVISGKGAR